MIPKKPAPDLIRGGNRFLEKIMLKQKAAATAMCRIRSATPPYRRQSPPVVE
jgi:hypothetical protein